MDPKRKDVKILKADHMLQAKVGNGSVDEKVLQKCQNVIDNNKTEFAPIAQENLNALKACIEKAQKQETDIQKLKQELTDPVLQLKANAAMFKYDLVGNMTHIMLHFLESINNLDQDVIAIIEAHHTTLNAIIKKEMKGDGGEIGTRMQKELKGACKRYFSKHMDNMRKQ